MSLSAWITNAIVAVVLYGGLGWCIAIAIRKGREAHARGSDDWSETDEE
jgi:hypothetical protein